VYQEFKDSGFVVLAFPCNQFGAQEPSPEPEIKQFVTKYGVDFPMFAKVDVNGPGVHPVYQAVKDAGGEFANPIEWNFVKFLVNKDGEVVKRFPSSFDKNAIRAAIEAALL